MSLGANVGCVREQLIWHRTEFVLRFAPANINEAERQRYYHSLYSLEVRKQHTSWMLARMVPVLRISADALQADDLTRLTMDDLTALREHYAGPPMDALTVLVNRVCDGIEPAPDEYDAAMAQATKAGQQERVRRLLERIPAERERWLREAASRRINHHKTYL